MHSGTIPETSGETWKRINESLETGGRGLPKGSSLNKLLRPQSPLTIETILLWITEYHDHTGAWPRVASGVIEGAPDLTWQRVNTLLLSGRRGLPGGSSLASLLTEHFGVKGRRVRPPGEYHFLLSIELILAWASNHKSRTGQWPITATDAIQEAPGETWARIDYFLRYGGRGLPGQSSLAKLFAVHFGVKNRSGRPPGKYPFLLSIELILGWASNHKSRTGEWPIARSGAIEAAPGETWARIDYFLRNGGRGLPGQSSLARLLSEQLGVKDRRRNPVENDSLLSIELILEWAESHKSRTGVWPSVRTGAIEDAPGETWARIDYYLHHGGRGLSAGSSLPRILGHGYRIKTRRRIPSDRIKRA